MLIPPKHINLQQARILKKLGFNVPCRYLYVDGKYRINYEKEGDLFDNGCPSTQIPYDWCLAPEQGQVIEWAFETHRYSIEAELNIPESGENDGLYVFNGVVKGSMDYKLKVFYKSKDYPKREQALSDAIDDFLKSLR